MKHFRCPDALQKLPYNELVWGLFFYADLLITYWVYIKGTSSSIQFDDEANLKGLSAIDSLASAVDFISNGQAGPLGRPVALFTFALQAYAWPYNPELLLEWNILIHLLNGALVTWLALNLSKIISPDQAIKPAVAVIAGAAWLLLPILVSSSLFIVQRMTILAATFIFSGLIFYTNVRIKALGKPDKHLFKLSFIVIVFTALAAFSKESGALLPVYILVIEATFLSSKQYLNSHLPWKIWKIVFLFFPLAIVFAYLINSIPYHEATVLQRDFTAGDRVAAQGFIIWQYLFNAFIPRPSALGPFHDTPWHLDTGRSIQGWCFFTIAMVATALAGLYRRNFTLLSFAVLWYFLGHLLESTTPPLEFYFEHRNYIPLLGPVFALISYLLSLNKFKKIIIFALGAYLLIISGITTMTTSLWGNKLLAAEIWAQENPKSVRATLHLARQLELSNNLSGAFNVLHHYNKENAPSIGLEIQELIVACTINPTADHSEQLQKLQQIAKVARFDNWTSELPEQLHSRLLQHKCKNLNFRTVSTIADQIINNVRYQTSPLSLYNLYILKGLIDLQYDDPEKALQNFDRAFMKHIGPESLKLALSVAKQQNKPELIEKWNKMAEQNH